MQYLFTNCSSMRSINLSNFETSLVINMEYMFTGCKNLISVIMTNIDVSLVTNMNYMFSDCHSLKYIEISDLKTPSLISMEHMFENCFSLVAINLSNFITENVKNAENMFANDYNLEYVNLQNANDNNIKNINSMFLGTLENMVFCLNETFGINIKRMANNKGCAVFDCTNNYSKNRKLIIASTNECVEKCPEKSIFFYKYKCFYKCPNETLPEDFICKEPIINETLAEMDDESCTVSKYFSQFCKKKFLNIIAKKKFIDSTVNDLLEGKLYNLMSISLEDQKIFTIREKTEIYSLYGINNKKREPNLTYIDIEDCVDKLINTYKLPYNDLIVFKVEYSSPYLKIPIIEYKLFGLFGTKKLTLHSCKNLKAHYYIPRYIEDYKEYKYNPNDKYYYDICSPYFNENNSDLTLYERRNEFNINNRSLCESNCIFRGYVDNIIHCECDIKIKFNSFLNTNIDMYNLIYRLPTTKLPKFNLWVFKCYMNLFTKEVILSNLSSQIILGIILCSIIGSLIFYFKEYNILFKKMKIIIEFVNSYMQIFDINKKNKKKKNKEIVITKNYRKEIFHKGKLSDINFSSSIKSGSRTSLKLSQKHSKNSFSSTNQLIIKRKIKNKSKFSTKEDKSKEIKKKYKIYEEKTYSEINSLSYNDALLTDKRTLCEIYYSVLMTRQLLLFTFNSKNDFNSRTIKICFLLNIFALSFTINTLFMDDNIMHDLVVLHGKIGIFFNLSNIIITAVITIAIKNILVAIIFTENDIISMRANPGISNQENIRHIVVIVTIKCYLFFVINFFTLCFMWAYISCFFSIFKNTHFFVLKNTLLSFGICLLSPIFLGFIPALMRWASLLSKDKKNRITTYYLAKIIQILIWYLIL